MKHNKDKNNVRNLSTSNKFINMQKVAKNMNFLHKID